MGLELVEYDEVSQKELQENTKALAAAAAQGTVQDFPTERESTVPFSSFVLQFATVADDIPAWGSSLAQRDSELRKFWITEPYLASAIYSTCIRNAGFTYALEGPDRTVRQIERNIFNMADIGRGWHTFTLKLCVDLYTQDNAAFIELIRRDNSNPDAPVLGIAHLDSFRCLRTGDPETPVVYTDRLGRRHKMKWWQIVSIEEFPSPIDTMYGAQLSAVSRVLRAAQVLRDIAVYKHEKVSGRFHKSIHLVSGIAAPQIEDAFEQSEETADNKGLLRYNQPLILGSIDPTANVGHVQIDLASLPDAFDEETTLKWYIAVLASGLGGDYQDFAPLPGGNLGTAQQSEILHRKTRGKGPALFMKLIEHIMNTRVLPKNVTFSYEEQDIEAAQEQARLKGIRAKTRAVQIQSGELHPKVARLQAVEDKDIPDEWLEMLDKEDEERLELMQQNINTQDVPPRENVADFDRDIRNE
jgi:hypothetical protein